MNKITTTPTTKQKKLIWIAQTLAKYCRPGDSIGWGFSVNNKADDILDARNEAVSEDADRLEHFEQQIEKGFIQHVLNTKIQILKDLESDLLHTFEGRNKC